MNVYHLRGKVVSTDAPHGIVVLDHEAIPGFMDAMTMPYQLKDPSIIGELHPGDVITADVLVTKSSEETVVLDHIVVVAQAKPDYKPPVIYHVPAPGDKVPDFALRNQDGRAIHLGQFKGKTLLLTFIYTRCPLPNFCPLVTHNFAVINATLAKNPALYGTTHLICVSFDPEHDTPERLRAYGATYIGSEDKEGVCALGFCDDDRQGDFARDGEVFRRGHHARSGRYHHAHAFDDADRSRREGCPVLPWERMDAGAGDRRM